MILSMEGSKQSAHLAQEDHLSTDRSCTQDLDRDVQRLLEDLGVVHHRMAQCALAPTAGITVGKAKGQFNDVIVTNVVQQNGRGQGPQATSTAKVKVCSRLGSSPFLDLARLSAAKAFVDNAVKMHKVFSIQGPYPIIRAALRARGWVERRMHPPNNRAVRHNIDGGKANTSVTADSDEYDCETGNVEKEQDTGQAQDDLHDFMSCLVRKETVYFYWTNRRDAINTIRLQKEQITNHFAMAGSFTTKAGLCVNLRKLHWFDSADPDTFFPRCYRLGALDEKHAFIEDYRRTACASFLKYIVEREKGILRKHVQKKGRKHRARPIVLSEMIDIALKVCQEFLESLEHRDIDTNVETSQMLTNEEWKDFLDSYYYVVHGSADVKTNTQYIILCEAMLQSLAVVCPQLDVDGIHNIWIIKPGAMSRGRGIKCAKRLDQILDFVGRDPVLITDSKWVVQKYLERPLLIHGTKFDVRQWFLVTDWNPLTVWFYKKCYMRFSTQLYSLDTLDSSVHLCNNSIQKHLKPSQQRHKGIPADNMWSSDQFKKFLSSQGREAQWHTVVVPGMKKAVIHAVQTAQDLIESRKNTFELYGADFMLGRNLCPWLIEINGSPTMAPSTPVTAQLCAAVQEDTIRVVLDRKADRTARTGDFELIYKQAAVKEPQYVGAHLLVEGFKIKCPCPLPPLKNSSRSAPKQRVPMKEKEPAADKVTSLPKLMLRTAETSPGSSSSGILPPPHLPPEPPLPVPTQTFNLDLPSTVKSVHLPTSIQPDFEFVWKRKEESTICSKNIQTKGRQQSFLGQEKTGPKQSGQQLPAP